ncbi:MAG: hypothetical protein NW204_09435 [Xanthomonadaceae bacterium]|nr:hypothetical protein [Xanthomonadaceae bacterium]
MKRSGLGGWALVALVCVGATLAVARLGLHDGDAPAPVPAPVADLPVAGAPLATGPSADAEPVSTAVVSAAQAMEMRLAAERGTDTEYASYLSIDDPDHQDPGDDNSGDGGGGAVPVPTPDFAACFNLLNTQPHGCTRDLAEAGSQKPTSLIPSSYKARLQKKCVLWVGAWDQAHCQ